MSIVEAGAVGRVLYGTQSGASGVRLNRSCVLNAVEVIVGWAKYVALGTGLFLIPPGREVKMDGILWSAVASYTILIMREAVDFQVFGLESIDYVALDHRRWKWLCAQVGFLPKVHSAFRYAYKVGSPVVSLVSGESEMYKDEGRVVDITAMELVGGVTTREYSGKPTQVFYSAMLDVGVSNIRVVKGTVDLYGMRLVAPAMVTLSHSSLALKFTVLKDARVLVSALCDEYLFDGGGPSDGDEFVSGEEYMSLDSWALRTDEFKGVSVILDSRRDSGGSWPVAVHDAYLESVTKVEGSLFGSVKFQAVTEGLRFDTSKNFVRLRFPFKQGQLAWFELSSGASATCGGKIVNGPGVVVASGNHAVAVRLSVNVVAYWVAGELMDFPKVKVRCPELLQGSYDRDYVGFLRDGKKPDLDCTRFEAYAFGRFD